MGGGGVLILFPYLHEAVTQCDSLAGGGILGVMSEPLGGPSCPSCAPAPSFKPEARRWDCERAFKMLRGPFQPAGQAASADTSRGAATQPFQRSPRPCSSSSLGLLSGSFAWYLLFKWKMEL